VPSPSRFDLVRRGVQEAVTEEELRALLEREPEPKAYVGYEPSGYVHIGSGVIMAEKIKDLVAAGFDFTFLLADWHAMINNKLGGDFEAIRTCAKYFEDAFRALGVPDSVGFAFADDLVAGSPYWADVIRVSKAASVARIKRALTIMGRKEEDAELDASMLIYPAMQVTDIHVLDLDLALGGMDQRHAHMLYRDLAPKLGWKQVVAVHTPLLVGLKGKGRMDAIEAKMSKSKPETAILIHDPPEEIARKVEKAFCPPKDTEDNFVTEVARLILLPKGPLTVERPAKFGGDVTYANFEELAKAYRAGDLHPKDLKTAVSRALADRLAPVGEYFDRRSENLDALRKILAA
jgi:tyrosyl-tRNA synthetase